MWKLLLLAPLASLMGCGTDCNLMYSPSNLQLVFDPEITAEGTWTFELTGDFDALCEVDLPVPDPSDMAYTPCGGVDLVDLGLSDDGVGVTDLHVMNEAPASLTLIVSFDGSVVFEDTFTPSYDVDEPNGTGCGERYSASVSVEVPEP